MNQVMRGNSGRVWVNNQKLMMLSGFEAKITGEYEEMDIAEVWGKVQSYQGFSGAGTIKKKKMDNDLAKTIAEGFATGIMPDIKIVGELDDTGNSNAIRVEFTGVTFDEVMLLGFEPKKGVEEEFPFKFESFAFL